MNALRLFGFPRRGAKRPQIPLQLQPVWQHMTPALQQELVAFWLAHGALVDPRRAAHRAGQAVCLGRTLDGALAAVGTAEVRVLPRLRQPMYYFRLFLAKSVRGQGHMATLFNACKATLESYNASLPVPESLGVLVELESRFLAARYKHAYEPQMDSTFIGYSPRGLPLRVSYFRDAVLVPPPSAAHPPSG